MICKKTSVIILTFFNWNVKMKGLIKDKENLKKKTGILWKPFFIIIISQFTQTSSVYSSFITLRQTFTFTATGISQSEVKVMSLTWKSWSESVLSRFVYIFYAQEKSRLQNQTVGLLETRWDSIVWVMTQAEGGCSESSLCGWDTEWVSEWVDYKCQFPHEFYLLSSADSSPSKR